MNRFVRIGRATLCLGPLWLTGAAGCGDFDDRQPIWSAVSGAVIQPNCATGSCHNRGAAVAGLDLSTVSDGYDSLTDLDLPRRGRAEHYPRELVTPYNAEQSRLVRLLRMQGPGRMPPDRPLTESDIRLIERWITNGAQRD